MLVGKWWVKGGRRTCETSASEFEEAEDGALEGDQEAHET